MSLNYALGITLMLLVTPCLLQSQSVPLEYKRSSLHLTLIESETFPRMETVLNAWNTYPFPDKYNNHTISANRLTPWQYEVTPEDRELILGKKESLVEQYLKESIIESSNGLFSRETEDMPVRIHKFAEETQLAKQLVSKWFNRNANGTFDMKLIQERGFYNATDLEVKAAAGQARGLAALGDAGEQLINYTFVVFSQLKFVANEAIARDILTKAEAEASKIVVPFLQEKALKTAQQTYERTKEGYSVWTKSWLYKLRWNEEIANTFYTQLWNNPTAFDTSTIFKLEYIGKTEAATLVTFSLQEKRTEEQVIEIATVRNIDRVFAKLQREYDVFKPKIPVLTGEPITAKIGMKEGLEGGEPFEVLELVKDPLTGLTTYQVVGRVQVDKEKVWDNRYNAGEAVENQTGPGLDRTLFSGPKRIQPGMLLRQVK